MTDGWKIVSIKKRKDEARTLLFKINHYEFFKDVFLKNFIIILKMYFQFKVITKCWLYFPYYNKTHTWKPIVHPNVCTSHTPMSILTNFDIRI